jgi:hypothetical protein
MAPSATGIGYVLVVRLSFISSALPDGPEAAADGADLAGSFLGAARAALVLVFGILFLQLMHQI